MKVDFIFENSECSAVLHFRFQAKHCVVTQRQEYNFITIAIMAVFRCFESFSVLFKFLN